VSAFCDLMADLRAAGITVRASAGRLVVQPASQLTNGLRERIKEHRAAFLAADIERHWRFQVTYRDGRGFEARTLPEATAQEAVQLWPGATVEPLPDVAPAHRVAVALEAELRAHLERLWGTSHPDYPAAWAAALASPDAHLANLRELERTGGER
jgi:uncharacterized protein with von Willebrand factor type A (vWA) domain